jgi:phosphatidylglycerol:prolipoprotein diacylglycerol transferase
MADTVWVHNLDPFLIQFNESIGIRWYGLAYVTGFVCAFLFMKWFSEKRISPITVEQASDFLTTLILGVLLGGRLGYALFYSPQLFTDFRSEVPFWGLLAVWEGGMASHGGFVGVFVACLVFAKRHQLSFPHLGDLTVVGAMIGIGLGRIANFINGELMGKICAPDFPLAVKFPQDIYRWIGYQPENLKSLATPAELLGVGAAQFNTWNDNVAFHKGKFYDLAGQIIQRIQAGDQAMVDAVRPILEPRHPSQLYASFTEAWIPLTLLMILWRKPRKPGVIGASFLVIYSIGRIFNENFRLPDAHIADLNQQPLGISRGQFISLWMLLAGIALLIWTMRRRSEKLGGWAQS